MANFQTHHHKSAHHRHRHCHGSHLTESHNASDNTDHHLSHSVRRQDTHEHADIHLHHNPHHHHHHHHHHKQHKKHHRSSKMSHQRTSTISSNASMSSAGCSSFSSSASSSCSSSSGSLTSSSSTNSASSSSNSSSSSSFSSSSCSSSSSRSSSWSSENSVEDATFASKFKEGVRCPQHSQSCTDISRRRRAFEEDEEDTVPLLNEDGHVNKSGSIKKYLSLKKTCKDTTKGPVASHMPSRRSTLKKKKGQTEIIRKAKSMEVLPMQNKQSGEGELDPKECERWKEEARKNILEEKKKFSAFLNEITRQVISPSRLQTLGVTDAHRAISPATSQNSENKGHKKTKHSSNRSGSTNSSVSSSAPFHTIKHSSPNKKGGQAPHSNTASNSIKHHHHHQHKTEHRNPKRLHHSVNRHSSNKTGPSKSHLKRSEHGHKAHKKQQAQSSSHLTNETAMDTNRNTHRTHSLSPVPHHHYNNDDTHRGDHHSSSSCPHSPSLPPHQRIHQRPDHHSLHTESHHSHLESHHHHSPSLSNHHHRKTDNHVPRSETHHRHHSHSKSHNHHHDDDRSPFSHKHSLCSETDHHPHSESHHHIPSSPLYHLHHGDQRHSTPENTFPHLKSTIQAACHSAPPHHSPSPSHQHHHSDGDHRSPSPHQYSLYSKNYDNSHSESPHHSPSPSHHYRHNDGDHRSSFPAASQHHHCGDQRSPSPQHHSSLLKSQDHLESRQRRSPSPLHHLHQDHKNPPPHLHSLHSKAYDVHPHSESHYCDSYSGSHHSSLPDIQNHSSHTESYHPHHNSISKDSHQYHTSSPKSYHYDNSHHSSSELAHHLHHDSSPHQFHGQHHSSYPDVHDHHSHHPSDDNHHRSYPDVHTHTEGGLKSPINNKSDRQCNSPYIDRQHQHSSYLDCHFNHHHQCDSGDPNTATLNRPHHTPDGHFSHHHPHNLSHSLGHHQCSHPNPPSSTHSESYHHHDHLQSPHLHSHSEAKLQPLKEFDHQPHHNSPESNKDTHQYSEHIPHHSHQNQKQQELHNLSHLESSYHHLHTESQHHPEHSETHQHSHSEFQKSSHRQCHRMPSHPMMESHHHQYHKHPESHHQSHPKSLLHCSHSDMWYDAPKSHHHHNAESYPYSKSYHNSQVEIQHQSDVKSHHDCSESHQHFHAEEHHHHGDDPIPLRHSPVGEKATSPCSSKPHSSKNPGSPISHDDHSVTYKEAALTFKEKGSEYERIMMLQEQNEDLHNTLRQTVVRMECLGAEFITEHHQLESELQRTRVELSGMMDKFTRLQANYSSIQTDDFREDEGHCMDEHMDADREKLNQRISELTKQLSAARTTIQSLETINVTSMLQEALVKHFKSDDPIKPFKKAIAPPPFQFMDSDSYNNGSVAGDEQLLGPVPEEDESDWSEMGEEANQYDSSSLERGQHGCTGFSPWRQEKGCWVKSDKYGRGAGDTESESGEEEMSHREGLQIPHLQFSIHPETLPVPVANLKQNLDGPVGEEYHVCTGRQLSSPIRILSASLEGINSTDLRQLEHHGRSKCTKGKIDLLHPQQGEVEDRTEDELTHTRKMANKQHNGDGEKGAGSSGSQPMANLESAQKMLNHFIQEGEKTKL